MYVIGYIAGLLWRAWGYVTNNFMVGYRWGRNRRFTS